MKKEIENYLMDHFNGRGNEYNEAIEVFQITDDEVIIETWVTFEVDVTTEGSEYPTANDLKEGLKEELAKNGTCGLIGSNYVCGFYCEFFEDLSPNYYLKDADIVLHEDKAVACVHIPMSYTMDLDEIKKMYNEYKMSA